MTSTTSDPNQETEEFQPDRRLVVALWAFAALCVISIVAISGIIVFGSGDPPAAAQTPEVTQPPVASGDPLAGQAIFAGTCTACHGADGTGVPGLGPSFAGNVFVAGNTDDEMVAFLKVGRATDDPANTTGVAMPPKGGNPSLSEADLSNVVAFLRTLN
jgi:disulfide bond formation protein DsbB